MATFLGKRPADPMTLEVWPGADGREAIYEDDGLSLGYAKGECAGTPIRLDCQTDHVRLTIGDRRGTYQGAHKARAWVVEVNGIAAPQAGRADGGARRRTYTRWPTIRSPASSR